MDAITVGQGKKQSELHAYPRSNKKHLDKQLLYVALYLSTGLVPSYPRILSTATAAPQMSPVSTPPIRYSSSNSPSILSLGNWISATEILQQAYTLLITKASHHLLQYCSLKHLPNNAQKHLEYHQSQVVEVCAPLDLGGQAQSSASPVMYS